MVCHKPIQRKDANNVLHEHVCGSCYACKSNRIQGWIFRLEQELKVSTTAYFITLTYATEKVPITQNGLLTIQKRDLQLFFKKLRKDNVESIKYFACGEYGSKTIRPHYHIILFNAKQQTIQENWVHGHVHYGDVNSTSIAYTLKYIFKDKANFRLNDLDDRSPEFQLQSKGLGKNFLTDNLKSWYNQWWQPGVNEVPPYYAPGKDGKKIPLPRYYKEKLFTKEQRLIIGEMIQEEAYKKKPLSKKELQGYYTAIQHAERMKAIKAKGNKF